MAHANANVSRPFIDAAAPFYGASAKISKMMQKFASKQRRRRTMEQLAFYDDRLLEDIGMPRSTVAVELGYDPRLVKAMTGISVPR